MMDKEELYAQCEDLYRFKPENDLDIYQNIDMTIELFSELIGEDLHFEPLFEKIKIAIDEILAESNGKVNSKEE